MTLPTSVRVRSGFDVVGRVPPFDDAVIAEEPSLWLVDQAEARARGGPITRAFVEALPPPWRDEALILSRVAWLEPGWRTQPAPFHCDNLPRRPDGEQDFTRPPAETPETVGCLMGCCPTDFVVGEGDLPLWPLGRPQTVLQNAWLDRRLRAGAMQVEAPPEGVLFRFGWGDFHRAGRARRAGWRVLLRAVVRDRPARGIPAAIYASQYNEYAPETVAEWAAYAPYAPDATWDAPGATASAHRRMERLGALAAAAEPRGETPVFAARVAFAAEVGGPLTRAFVAGLPPAWRAPDAPVVVDSELLWVRRGATGALPLWHREPFPRHAENTWLGTARRRRGGGARALANAEVAVEHIVCHVGAGGDIDVLLPAPEDAVPLEDEPGGRLQALRARDAALRAAVTAGDRRLVRVPAGQRVRLDGATLWRARPAERSGFLLRLRATWGSQRPCIDALRNLCAP